MGFIPNSSSYKDETEYTTLYQDIYKPLASFLYANPDFKFSFYFTGIQLEWLKKRNPEFFDLIKQLTARKQIEILGGGFYNPVFPLLFPLDRTGQIEMLSSELRKTIGKRPRGLAICADAWEPSLLASFQSCGMEYVLLDNNLISPPKRQLLPIVMNDKGKSINILPVSSNFIDSDEDVALYLKRIAKETDKIVNSSPIDRVLAIKISEEKLKKALKDNSLQTMFQLLNEKYSESIQLSLPHSAIRYSEQFVQAYIPTGVSSDVAKWSFEPYKTFVPKTQYPVSIHDFLQTYKSRQALYDRMIYVSLLVNQCHGDKMRKKAAREKLWAAQLGDAYVGTNSDVFVNSLQRQNAYKSLNEAEKIVRECSGFHESVTKFDYNSDGFNEYVCRLDKYIACIGLQSGSVFELDILKSFGNYADNNSRILPFDSCDDNYQRGFFIDHLLEKENYEKYVKGIPCKNGIFSNHQYKEVSFQKPKNEICLEAKADFPSNKDTTKQNIILRKKYTINSNGIMVQYILKNEGSEVLKGNLAVESNFAIEDIVKGEKPMVSVVTKDEIKQFSTDTYSSKLTSSGIIKDVSALQFNDYANNVSFMFEPNENSDITFYPIQFKRPINNSTSYSTVGKTFCLAFVWNVELEGGKEIEKTINMSITYSKRKSKDKDK